MKTETIKLTRTEIQYLMNLVQDHIASGVYWGDNKKFHEMQDRVLDKLSEGMMLIDPELKGFVGEY